MDLPATRSVGMTPIGGGVRLGRLLISKDG
jgi:hypothetical protein